MPQTASESTVAAAASAATSTATTTFPLAVVIARNTMANRVYLSNPTSKDFSGLTSTRDVDAAAGAAPEAAAAAAAIGEEAASGPSPRVALERQAMVQRSRDALQQAFGATRVHADRLIYALAGTMFFAWAPMPFGGARSSPGFTTFSGASAADLLHYIVAESFAMYWQLKGRDALDFTVASANEVLDLHYRQDKENLDERMLKGMKKAGHIRWQGQNIIPAHLAHVDEGGMPSVTFVEFTPYHVLKLRMEQKYGEKESEDE
ncbi:hypothetical protein HDU82_002126 [Entophlyctis luteolus]|nr:hypothetical protein HDU82_002126 [Entophlyctis luteolus]KAJ3382102.1 hypothetical protein HDU84_004610 [Entophlyctis sp. JEL0112]